MFEEFGMGVEKQVVTHLLEELGVEGQMEDLGSMVTWHVPYEDDRAKTMKELKAVLDEHADILDQDLPGAVIGIKFHRQNSQSQFTTADFKYCVTAVTVFRKGLRDSLYEWMDSKFGGIEPVRVEGADADVVEYGDANVDYFWYSDDEDPELNVAEEVYDPLVNLVFGHEGFIASPDDASLDAYSLQNLAKGLLSQTYYTGDFIKDWFESRYGKRFDYLELN